MANEIQIHAAMTHSSSSPNLAATTMGDPDTAFNITQSVKGRTRKTQIISFDAGMVAANAEQVDLGDLTSAAASGWPVLLFNRDATNYVQVYIRVAGTNHPFCRMLAGEPCGPFRLVAGALTSLYALANTANCVIEVMACDQ